MRPSPTFVATLLALVGSASSQAASLYVSPTGSDCASCGTASNPFKTIQKAADLVNPGDTVYVLPGTYPAAVETKRAGTAANRIRFVSPSKWKAVLKTSGIQYIWRNWVNYITIEGFEVTGDARTGILNYGSYVKILGNHVHHLGRADCSDWGAGDMGAAINNAGNGNTSPRTATSNEVIGNWVHDASFHCPPVQGIPGMHGIYHAYGSGVIANNVVYRAASYGIHLYHWPVGVRVIHNTVFSNRSGFVVGGSEGTADDIYVANNIFYDNPGTGMRLMGSAGGNVRYVNNLLFDNGTDFDARAVNIQSQTIFADAKFVSYNPTGTGDYRLLSTSPARDQGLPLTDPQVRVDFAGLPRPSGPAPDVGANEYGAAPDSAAPRAPANLAVR